MTGNARKDHYPSIVFFGTPAFGAGVLDYMMQEGIPVSGVVTAPDKPAGRGRKLIISSVKKTAIEYDLPVLQPENLKYPDFHHALKQLKPQLQVVVAFRMLPAAVWEAPPLGTFNLHASLLPQYRGAAPIQWVLMNGEKTTGVTTFFLSHDIDTGKIIFQEKIPVDAEDDAGTLSQKLLDAGKKLVVHTIDAIVDAKVSLTDQRDLITGELKPAPKIKKENTRISWDKPPERIGNLVRAMSPAPGAVTTLELENGRQYLMKIFKASPAKDNTGAPYPAFNSDGKTFLEVKYPKGALRILELQIEGKKRMPVTEFLKGFPYSKVRHIT